MRGREREREGGREREGERERQTDRETETDRESSGLSQSVRFFPHLFCFMQWALCSEGEMAQKRTHYHFYTQFPLLLKATATVHPKRYSFTAQSTKQMERKKLAAFTQNTAEYS